MSNNLVLNRVVNNSKLVETVLNISDDGKTLEIYDAIMPYKWHDDTSVVTDSDVKTFLKNTSGDITVRINSRGGEVGTALAIYNRLKDHDGKVTTINDGYAFSCAGWLMLAGEDRLASDGSVFMMHNPMMYPEIKSENDIESVANAWRVNKKSIKEIFVDRSKLTDNQVDEFMNKETYMNSDDGIKYGIYTSTRNQKANLKTLNCLNIKLPDEIRAMIPDEPVINSQELLEKRQILKRKYLQK